MRRSSTRCGSIPEKENRENRRDKDLAEPKILREQIKARKTEAHANRVLSTGGIGNPQGEGCMAGTPGSQEDHLQGNNQNTTENVTNVLDHVVKSSTQREGFTVVLGCTG